MQSSPLSPEGKSPCQYYYSCKSHDLKCSCSEAANGVLTHLLGPEILAEAADQARHARLTFAQLGANMNVS